MRIALSKLCHSPSEGLDVPIEEDVKPKIDEGNIIDLTIEDVIGRGEEEADVDEVSHGPDYSYFAHDESRAQTRELLECLSVDDLKDIAKQTRLKPKDHRVCPPLLTIAFPSDTPQRATLIAALLHSTSQQQTLKFESSIDSKGKAVLRPPEQRTLHSWSLSKKKPPPRQTTINFAPVAKTGTVVDRLRELATQKLGMRRHVLAWYHLRSSSRRCRRMYTTKPKRCQALSKSQPRIL